MKGKIVALGAAAVVFYASGHAATPGHAGPAAAKAVAYARDQIGHPYLWGATGPDAFDCSGLVMMAYRSAGISIARTSQAQWATERHVPESQVRPGDLVFFVGSLQPGESSPGHVGIVIGGGKMIQALGKGTLVMVSKYTTRTDLVGFTDPAARGSA